MFDQFSLCVGVSTVVVALLSALFLRNTGLPLPPGPPPKWLSGNVHQMPRTAPWATFAEWSRQYGSAIIHYRFFRRHFIILNTIETVLPLLEHRSNIYSDRPMTWMLSELAGRRMSVFNISSQHPNHKNYRRLLQYGLNSRAVQVYRSILERELQILLDGLMDSPDNFPKHFRRNAGAIVLDVAYGWPVRIISSLGTKWTLVNWHSDLADVYALASYLLKHHCFLTLPTFLLALISSNLEID